MVCVRDRLPSPPSRTGRRRGAGVGCSRPPRSRCHPAAPARRDSSAGYLCPSSNGWPIGRKNGPSAGRTARPADGRCACAAAAPVARSRWEGQMCPVYGTGAARRPGSAGESVRDAPARHGPGPVRPDADSEHPILEGRAGGVEQPPPAPVRRPAYPEDAHLLREADARCLRPARAIGGVTPAPGPVGGVVPRGGPRPNQIVLPADAGLALPGVRSVGFVRVGEAAAAGDGLVARPRQNRHAQVQVGDDGVPR